VICRIRKEELERDVFPGEREPLVLLTSEELERFFPMDSSEEGDVILTIEDIPSPVVIITCGADKDTMNFYEVVKFAAEICVQYSDALGSDPVSVSVFHDNSVEKVYASACSRQLLEDLAV